jgi:NNP family nitrate/nitrite transporter-like MFS transporter
MSGTIQNWEPENEEFWRTQGATVARRNLLVSIPALFLAFAVWMVWSVVTTRLNSVGFSFSTGQLFWLTALPALSGATLRIFYSFLVPVFGGRRWTALSTASLLVPALWMGLAVQDPSTPYWQFVVIALLCGLGGGNFASSMSNISFFYPKKKAGAALGLNAGFGNLGVSGMQFLVPVVLGSGLFGALAGGPATTTDGKTLWLQNAGFLWILPVALVSLLAWFLMDDLATAKASVSDQMVVFRRKNTWIMSWIYLATFGSFIGYAAAFPMLIKTQFPDINALKFAFLGPLVGALSRPLGGWISDKLGGARVTLVNFVVMGGAVLGAMHFLPEGGQGGSFPGFFAMFLLLFFTTGIGNGSTFRMIPVMFRGFHERRTPMAAGASEREKATRQAAKESAAVIGFTSAVGAYGGFLIPLGFGSALKATGSANAALLSFLVFYATCIAATWWWYARRNAESPC